VLLKEYNGSNKSKFIAAIKKCLQDADRKGYSSIAFPAIGSGGMRYPHHKLANWFKKQFFSFQGINLKNIDIVLHPSDPKASPVSLN